MRLQNSKAGQHHQPGSSQYAAIVNGILTEVLVLFPDQKKSKVKLQSCPCLFERRKNSGEAGKLNASTWQNCKDVNTLECAVQQPENGIALCCTVHELAGIYSVCSKYSRSFESAL